MFQPQIFRIPPKLPVKAVRTYALQQPLATHWRVATCAEVDCPRYLDGWRTPLDLSTQDGQNAAAWIRQSGLRFTEEITGPQQIVFVFPAGQLCPRSTPGHPKRHRAPLSRPPRLLVRDGDWRGNPTGWSRLHQRPEDWRDDMGEHLQRLAEARKQG